MIFLPIDSKKKEKKRAYLHLESWISEGSKLGGEGSELKDEGSEFGEGERTKIGECEGSEAESTAECEGSEAEFVWVISDGGLIGDGKLIGDGWVIGDGEWAYRQRLGYW